MLEWEINKSRGRGSRLSSRRGLPNSARGGRNLSRPGAVTRELVTIACSRRRTRRRNMYKPHVPDGSIYQNAPSMSPHSSPSLPSTGSRSSHSAQSVE